MLYISKTSKPNKMKNNTLKYKLSLYYLLLVPLFVTVLGFGVGHISYIIYLPVWILNVIIMVLAAGFLYKGAIGHDTEKKQIVIAALLIFSPWVLFSIFAGMGPPPSTAAEWTASATEQQARYYILIVGGILSAFGFVLLKANLTKAGESIYAQIGFTALMIAIPLFILNMIFWGSYLTELFSTVPIPPLAKKPVWYYPIRDLFTSIRIIEVSLIYFSTACFAISLKITGLIKPVACNFYVAISVLAILLNVLPGTVPEPFATLSYLAYVPAFTFLMPYFIGVNLLKRLGDSN